MSFLWVSGETVQNLQPQNKSYFFCYLIKSTLGEQKQ